MSLRKTDREKYERLRRAEDALGLEHLATKAMEPGRFFIKRAPDIQIEVYQSLLQEYVLTRKTEIARQERIHDLCIIALITWLGAMMGAGFTTWLTRPLPPPTLSAAQSHSTEEQRTLEGADAGSLHPFEEGPVSQEPAVDAVDVEPIVDDRGPGIEATGGSEPPASAGDAGKIRLKAPGRRPSVDDPLDLAPERQRLQQ